MTMVDFKACLALLLLCCCAAGESRPPDCADHRESCSTPTNAKGLLQTGHRDAKSLAGMEAKHQPQVGASIAVHPPKFPFLAQFLEQWAQCQAAQDAMSLFVVFSVEKDYQDFRKVLAHFSAHVPEKLWHPVIANLPEERVNESGQTLSAWKKWLGVAHMMDLGSSGPKYGLPVDSELKLFNASDCDAQSSAWHSLTSRIEALEKSKKWPVAQVGTSAKYNFGTYTKSGKDYDQGLIWENFNFITRGNMAGCKRPECKLVEEQIEKAQFSWWTDLPYVNLQVARDMMEELQPGNFESWQERCRKISWPRFEHIAYQQWCVLHEKYHFDDVTNMTGLAKWGSYLEDPPDGARLEPLKPLWASAEAVTQVSKGSIPRLSTSDPPLLLFHVDHAPAVGNADISEKNDLVVSRWKKAERKVGFRDEAKYAP